MACTLIEVRCGKFRRYISVLCSRTKVSNTKTSGPTNSSRHLSYVKTVEPSRFSRRAFVAALGTTRYGDTDHRTERPVARGYSKRRVENQQ